MKSEFQGGKVGVVKISDIKVADRAREDYGDQEMAELIKSIKERGLICPLAVYSENGEPPYQLQAGGRRYLALTFLKWAEVPCRVYDHPLSELELLCIELDENLKRKQLTPFEESKLIKKIDDTHTLAYGKKISTAKDASGWSQTKTAEFIGKSKQYVSEAIQAAQVHQELPQLKLDESKTRQEILKKLKTLKRDAEVAEIARRAEKELKKSSKDKTDLYMVGDFLELVKKIPDNTMHLCEIDPPYAIELQKIKKSEISYEATYGESYNEIGAQYYPGFMQQVFKECYRIMRQDSWLIVWFAPEPWAEPMYQWIMAAGFETRRLYGEWVKPNGQTQQPDIYLANATEYFFYARKGQPRLNQPGRANTFLYNPVPPQHKIHPTERPVELMKDILRTFCCRGSAICVPFAGSGVTIWSAIEEGMVPIGTDLSEDYKKAFIAKFFGEELKK